MSNPNININVGGPANNATSQYKTKFLKYNIPFATQVTEPNTKYVIKHNFDLGGEEVTIPANCVLEFDGGTIRNGILKIGYATVIGNGTTIYCPIVLDADGYRDRGALVNDITIDCLFKYDDAFTTTRVNYAVINNLRVRNFKRYGINVESETYETQFNNFECLSYELYESLERPDNLCNCGLHVNATDNHFFNGLIKHCWCGFYLVNSDSILENIHVWGSGGVTRLAGIVSSVNKLNNIYCDSPAAYNPNIELEEGELSQLKKIYSDIPYSYNGPLGLLFTSSGNVVNNINLTIRDNQETYPQVTYLLSTERNAWGNVVNNVVVPDHFDGSQLILYNGNNKQYKQDNYIKIANVNTNYGTFWQDSFFFDNPTRYRYISGGTLVINDILDCFGATYDNIYSRERLVKENSPSDYTHSFDFAVRQIKSDHITFDFKTLNNTAIPQIKLTGEDITIGGKSIQTRVKIFNKDINNILTPGTYYGNCSENDNIPYDSGCFILTVSKNTDYTYIQSLIHTSAGESSICRAIYRTVKVNDENVKTIDQWTYSDGSMAFRYNGWDMPYGNYLFEGLQHFHPECKKPVYWDGSRWIYSNGFAAIVGSNVVPVYGNIANRPKLSTEEGGKLDATKDIGFIYNDWELGKIIVFRNVRDGKIHWCDVNGFTATKTAGTTLERPVGWHEDNGNMVGVLAPTTDIGFVYYDINLHKPIYADSIDVITGVVTWVDATGTSV